MKKVAIITRTKNRPIMLKRTLQSIFSQTFTDFSWIIVNDGGEKESVNKIAETARSKGIDLSVFHNSVSCGMEAASNLGLKNSESEYVAIHDDDDNWEPSFLEACISFLYKNSRYKGVITQCWRIDEKVQNNKISVVRKFPFNPWLNSVQLIEIAKQNPFPPISFVYHRSVLDTIGLYDETLPVLGDWDFNLRFLEHFDIGVIPYPLANYHHRVEQNEINNAYGNSLYSGRSKHIEYDALFRNQLLRKDLSEGRIGLGFLVALGRLQLQAPLTDQLAFKVNRFLHRFWLTRWLWRC